MFQAAVNEKKFSVSSNEEGFWVNDRLIDLDLERISPEEFHAIENVKSYNISVISVDHISKVVKMDINGSEYCVALKDRKDILLEEMGFDEQSSKSKNEIKAPMPGLILDVAVTEGMEVKKGQPLLVLEAMKMENIIKSPSNGVISTVSISVGDSVDKNHTMIVL